MSNNNSNDNHNTGITLVDVRNEAFRAIDKLKDGNMDIETAKEIREFLKVIVTTGKTQVDFLNAIPMSIRENMGEETIKAMAGTLRDRDAEMDETMKEIDENKQKPYEFGGEES